MSFILIIITIILVALLTGKMIISAKYNKKIRELFSQLINIADHKFSHDQIKALPDPVQRYFKHVLTEGQFYISSMRLRHDGQFKAGLKNAWMNIEGEEYFIAEKPGYVWKGKTFMFTAIDSYVADKGSLTAYLFNIFKIADGKGKKYNQGELLRWLGESVCFPTNLLPKQNLQWLPVNDCSAKLNFQYQGISISYLVHFNKKNEITRMETERYMGNNKLEKWINNLGDYKEINGMIIPTKLEAGWQLINGYFPYAKFNIRNLEFNKPAHISKNRFRWVD